MTYKAAIERQIYSDTFKLHLWQPLANSLVEIWTDNGDWRTVEELTSQPDSGFILPLQAIDPIFNAFMEYKGLKTNDPTEVKVLREWLELEQQRVEMCLQKLWER